MKQRLLAIDTATTACSVALFEDERLIASDYEEIGRGHAEKLVPMIAKMPDNGKSGQILVNCGPGSFTGVRIGISTAKALALAWNASVHGYQCLDLIAAQALRQMERADGVYATIDGGHGECFVQNFSSDGLAIDSLQSLSPESAIKNAHFSNFAGSASTKLTENCSMECQSMHLLPDAIHVLEIPFKSRQLQTSPIYGRPPDAVANAKL